MEIHDIHHNKFAILLQTEVEKICRAILTLGLLHGTLYDDQATLEEQPEWLTYPHKMFQDFLSGYHNAKLILRSKSKVCRVFLVFFSVCLSVHMGRREKVVSLDRTGVPLLCLPGQT